MGIVLDMSDFGPDCKQLELDGLADPAYVVVGSDGSGDMYLLDTRTGKVHIYRHEESKLDKKAFDSLDTFAFAALRCAARRSCDARHDPQGRAQEDVQGARHRRRRSAPGLLALGRARTSSALSSSDTSSATSACSPSDVGVSIGQNSREDAPRDGSVPLTPRLEAVLRQLQATGDPDPFVLGRSVEGKFIHGCDRTVQRWVRRMQKAAGIPVFGPHRVRHSVLTYLAERGVKPYALQAFARHEDLKTTNRYYIHVNKRNLAREAVDALTMSLGNGAATLDNGSQFPVAP